MNVKLWIGALAVAVTLLVLWQARGPSVTLQQTIAEPVPTNDSPGQAPAVSANREGERGSMTNPLREKPTRPVSAEIKIPASSKVIGIDNGDQGTIDPDSLSLGNVDFLDSDQQFNQVVDALRLSAPAEMTKKQRNYEAFFAKLPAVAAAGVQVQDLLCGQKLCIGTVVGNQPQDMDAFFGSLSRTSSADAPIYSMAAVETQLNGATVRRFAFSTDPNIRGVPLRIGAN
jgi:hypothetical protein